MFIVGSSTYAQLLVVICIVAALSEVATHKVPFNYFEGFFAYLYCGSIAFFLYVFCYLLRSQRQSELKKKQRQLAKRSAKKKLESSTISISVDDNDSPGGLRSFLHRSASTFGFNLADESPVTDQQHVDAKWKKMKVSENEHSHGSFFLRAGAVG